MSILALSVSHKTAPVDVLARFALDPTASTKLVDALLASEHIDEVIALSTCNRTEIYAAVSRFHGALDDVSTTLADFAGVSVPELQAVCAVYFDEGAVAHTFSVASGLDSVVVGESQVLGQVKAALTHCQALGSVGTVLNTLFQSAIRVAKRVHSETGVGSAGRSLVTAAYEVLGPESRRSGWAAPVGGWRRGDGQSGRPDGGGSRRHGHVCEPHVDQGSAARRCGRRSGG